MSAITKVAALVLASGLLTGAGAGTAFAIDAPVDGGVVAVEETVVEAPVALVTEEEVAAAHATFKSVQAAALAAEKQAHADYQVAEKSALDATKAVKGGDKKAAQDQVQALRAANQAALKALKATNQVAVDEAKAAYQVLADLYAAQNTVVEVPVAAV